MTPPIPSQDRGQIVSALAFAIRRAVARKEAERRAKIAAVEDKAA